MPDEGVLRFRGAPVWSADSTSLGLTFESPVRLPEAFVWSARDGLRRRTTSNAESALTGLVSPTSHLVPTPDGRPRDRADPEHCGEQVPTYVVAGEEADGSAVLVVHGGPEAAAGRSWNPVVAGLALAGHTVVVPNVRGSAGYGRRWVSLDDVERRSTGTSRCWRPHRRSTGSGMSERRSS